MAWKRMTSAKINGSLIEILMRKHIGESVKIAKINGEERNEAWKWRKWKKRLKENENFGEMKKMAHEEMASKRMKSIIERRRIRRKRRRKRRRKAKPLMALKTKEISSEIKPMKYRKERKHQNLAAIIDESNMKIKHLRKWNNMAKAEAGMKIMAGEETRSWRHRNMK